MNWGDLRAGDVITNGVLSSVMRHAWLVVYVEEAGDVFSGHILLDIVDLETGEYTEHNRRRDVEILKTYHVLRGHEVVS